METVPAAVPSPDHKPATRRANLRTALTLASIAAVFFGGIIAAQRTGADAVWIGAIGIGILGFLLAARGRHVRN